MKKLKNFLEHIIYVDEEEEPSEQQPLKTAEVKKPETAAVKDSPYLTIQDLTNDTQKTVSNEPVNIMDTGRPKNVTVVEPEQKEESAVKVPEFINLNRPKKETAEENKFEAVYTVEEKPEEKPAPAEKKEETVASREIKREDYVPSSVISPMFGVQNNKTGKKGKKKPEVIPDLADINSDNKSVLGTVFSPMYGDKDAENPVPDDTVDPKVAKLSVQDIISDKKGETKPAVKPAVKPVKKETEKKAEEKKADNPAIRPTLSVFGNPIETKKPEVKAKTKPFIDVGKKKSESRMPDLSVTPFGTGGSARETEDQASAPVSIHDAWKETRVTSERKTEEIKKVLEEVERNISDEHNYENLSLFDVEDD